MKPLVLALAPLAAALPALAIAQPISPNVPPPPVNLDPGAAPVQTAPVPDKGASAAQPSVIVVGPDGKLQNPGAQPPAQNGYFVDEGTQAPDEADAAVRAGQTPELHVVRKGDTLWDICVLYFNDPWQWPKIWSYNSQITNPHWIYPGDLVRLLPRGMFTQAPTAATEPDTAATPPPIDAVPPPARRLEVGIKATAFVEKSGLEKSITIDGAVDEKVLLGNGDSVYMSYPTDRPPKVGDTYSIYQPGNVVKSNGKEVGAYVHVLGTVRITAVKQDKRAQGEIIEATQEIERGAKVGPLVKTFKTVPSTLAKVDAQGTVVALLSAEQLIGQGEVVFVDLGRASGVEVGNRMFVVRRGDALPKNMKLQIGQDDRQFPARTLGTIVIVDVGDKISAGLITLSFQEMSVGDLVVMQTSR